MAGGTDPRTPCIIGVGQRTWHPDDVGAQGAPEPLVMWDEVAHIAADDTRAGPRVLNALDSVQIVFCQTSQYDDAVTRLAARIGAEPRTRFYSGIGGTTPQVVVSQQCEAILRGDVDLALVTGAEALATQRKYKQRGQRASYSFRPAEKRAYPWEAPFHPAEVAHDVFQAWLTFALFDNARRARVGAGLDAYRAGIGEMLAPMTQIAARNPHAWYRVERTAAIDEELDTACAGAWSESREIGGAFVAELLRGGQRVVNLEISRIGENAAQHARREVTNQHSLAIRFRHVRQLRHHPSRALAVVAARRPTACLQRSED